MIKLKKVVFFIFLTISVNAFAQPLRAVGQEAFVPGEQLKYRVHYGFMDAGEATLTVSPTLKTVM